MNSINQLSTTIDTPSNVSQFITTSSSTSVFTDNIGVAVIATDIIIFGIAVLVIGTFVSCLVYQMHVDRHRVAVRLPSQNDEKLQAIDLILNNQV